MENGTSEKAIHQGAGKVYRRLAIQVSSEKQSLLNTLIIVSGLDPDWVSATASRRSSTPSAQEILEY